MCLYRSPPLARKARPVVHAEDLSHRFTSARAESPTASLPTTTSSNSLRSRGRARRPLWPARLATGSPPRGEHFTARVKPGSIAGSPPLARRTHGVAGAGAPFVRITSARAESTPSGPRQHWPNGSPSLARRAHDQAVQPGRVPRITSTRAESTRAGPRAWSGTPDHPRRRGEHYNDSLFGSWYGGSPPLAQRAPCRRRARPVPGRITSAHAERTCAGPRAWGGAPDRPRRCGEHIDCAAHDVIAYGSPPLAGRAPALDPTTRGGDQITSARGAESADRRRPSWPSLPDHLRLRGEHHTCQRRALGNLESPPPSRRERVAPQSPAAGLRITSARAENT
jgi:hypothetical protein